MPRLQGRRRGAGPRDSRGLPADGGWSFALDPDRPAASAPALWRPQACPLVAIAQPAPAGFAAVRLADLAHRDAIAAEALFEGDWHMVLQDGGRRVRLWIRCCAADDALAYVTPADRHAPLRLALASALHDRLAGVAASAVAAASPGPAERWRLAQWLRLLDAVEDGASTRDMAATLMRGDTLALTASEWDVSSERRRIARWRRAAVAMRDGGYRSLLGGV